MEIIKTRIFLVVTILLLALPFSGMHAETIIQCPLLKEPLDQKWEWAKKEAQARNLRNGFWIGYSIQRMMGIQEYFVTGTSLHFDSVRRNGSPSLSELVTGEKETLMTEKQPDDQKVKQAAQDALDDLENSKTSRNRVLKDLAILFQFNSLQSAGPEDFAMLNTSLSADLKKLPLIWLGRADEEQSLALLQKMYQEANSNELKEDLISSIGSHENSAAVFPFLRQILLGNSPASLRAAAAQSIGSTGHDEVIPLLLQVCKTDSSSEVREEALNGLEDIDSPAARTALIDLAKSSQDKELREDAVHIIAEHATPTEIAVIQDIVMRDPTSEVQEEALYALAELPDSASLVIQVARTHPKRDLREAALYALAENGSKEAVAALDQIARSDPDPDLQEAAMYALAELPGGKGIPYLVSIAKSHPDKQMRIRAVQVLGDSDDEAARAALLKLVSEN
jgi:HEAT repeat protein